ncbi:ER to Golgi protein transport [Trichoderma reesei QM6a]|uniref:ER to Golgi protein transport n=1 Tax=Hypocrea jecorina (strain QM6a) TaxID=431241 RepID=G0RD45_HYPJQ|nr:ER to Golgi protein transport [Trichoderma reesei QM6a]EGR50536.1 ER to Golgi protein transport [Trichoderma reesei QM6a]
MFSSISSTPAKQSVGDTISVLSGRLGSATLLEDRRAAVLGLRSFAKDYPATVASGALRGLIGSLSKDAEDVDTIKIVLETLLMLFNPNQESPEASDEIALWLADEFTQRQENITLVLDFLDAPDFYSRLYSLQLLSSILTARTQRTEECVLSAPLGISRLVAALDDQREAIRNEGVNLLILLTSSSLEIQKLVAFQNAFEKLFDIIAADGSLSEGGRTVEDCLILLANLLRGNLANQSLFRESGCIGKLTEMLKGLLEAQKQEDNLAKWAQIQHNRNIYAFLSIIRLFLSPGSAETHMNQATFWRHGLSYLVLQLAFDHDVQFQIKAEALLACGDLIRNNMLVQEAFASLMVPPPLESAAEMPSAANGQAKIYIIDGLLDLTLNVHDLSAFDLRYAACQCLKAYFSNHAEVKSHFLGRAIEGYQSGRDESANILSVLLRLPGDVFLSDPYRVWFAAVIAFHLLHDNPAAKAVAKGLTEGDASKGEEVVTSIQTITAHLLMRIRRDDDTRILVAYLMLLLGWLFEDLDAVNDFLSEGSNVQGLIQVISQPVRVAGELVQGLCAMLLGVVYEFSTKDSPIPRATLHSILESRLDRDGYVDRLTKLRNHPLLREFEVTPQKLMSTPEGEEVNVFFDDVFVDFFKDNFSRAIRALDKAPDIEVSVITNGTEQGISRQLVDSLRQQIEEKDRAIEEANSANRSLEGVIKEVQEAHRRAKEDAEATGARLTAEMRKLQSEQAATVSGLEQRIAQMQQQLNAKDQHLQTQLAAKDQYLQTQLSSKDQALKAQLTQAQKAHEVEAERARQRAEAEIADLRATVSRLEVDVMKANKSKASELQALRKEHADAVAERDSQLKKANEKAEEREKQLTALKEELREEEEESRTEAEKRQKDVEKLQAEADKLRQEAAKVRNKSNLLAKHDVADARPQSKQALADAEKAKDSVQSELDDLLMVFGDLEEKLSKYKARLRGLGQDVSDGEDDDGDDGSDEEEESEDEEKEKAVD